MPIPAITIALTAIYSAGICLGVLLAVLLWVDRQGNHEANRWLAATIACLAFLTLGSLLDDTDFVLRAPHLGYATDWAIFVVGPCVWLYVRRLTDQPSLPIARTALHFTAAILALALFLPFFALDIDAKRALLEQERMAADEPIDIVLAIAAIQILGYLTASLLRLVRYGRALRAEYSSIERLSFRWLRTMLIVCLIMWALWIAGQILHLEWAIMPNVMAVPLAMYILAFLALRQPAVFARRTSNETACEATSVKSAKYQKNAVRREVANALQARLEAMMRTDKPWLENDLTLTQLAASLQASPHHVSQVINDVLGKTFYDYINECRVCEVQRCLRDPAYDGQPILDIALASGFNSKAAFYKAFKQQVGVTPSAYRQRTQSVAEPSKCVAVYP